MKEFFHKKNFENNVNSVTAQKTLIPKYSLRIFVFKNSHFYGKWNYIYFEAPSIPHNNDPPNTH